MPGPLPTANPTRRNKPTIPTTMLPASGRKDPPPSLPPGKKLAKAGKAWWIWAWASPQAAAWDDGAQQFVFRRAELEDDLSLLDTLAGNQLDIGELVGMGDRTKAVQELKFVIRHLQALAGGKLT